MSLKNLFKDNSAGGVIKSAAEGILTPAAKLIDTLHVSDAEKGNIKVKLTEVVMTNLSNLYTAQADVLKTEMSGNWLQRSWRPILMLTFGIICVVAVFYEVKLHDVPSDFWDLLKIGIGGYVGGRSLEKVADTVTKNVDLSSLKRKDRSENIK